VGDVERDVSTFRNVLALATLALSLSACASTRPAPADTAAPVPRVSSPLSAEASPPQDEALPLSTPSRTRIAPEIIRGTSGELRQTARPRPSVIAEGEGTYTLNFENADIRDVVKAVLGDMLQLNYTIDPAVQGSATIHTARPLARAAVLPATEAALRVSGVALVARGQGYEVVPLQDAARRTGFALPDEGRLAAGFHVELVPLQFVAAEEIHRLLEPVAPPGTIVRVDPARNVVILAGTEADLASLVDTISIFDVDWMRSQSFALYPLSYAPARAVAAELGQVIGGQGPLAGLVRIVPIERLNAILVISKQAAYVEEMRGWIERFDRGGDTGELRFFIYHVQNGRATDLAVVLQKVLRSGAAGTSVAPSNIDTGAPPPEQGALPPQPNGTPTLPPPTAAFSPGPATGRADADNGSPVGDLHITADDTNNALIIMATPDRYRLIESALQQLDTVPLQVLIEAVVAEVTLTNNLQYGVQFLFTSGRLSGLSSASQSTLGLDPGGLSLLFTHGTSITALLDLLSTVTDVRVVSSPAVLVLNNRTASIQVGDEVPVATASAVSVQSAGAPVVNSIQMLDTGVILHVTPRVNRGGLVLMEIAQEVSDSIPTTSSGINSPTIEERKVASTVVVQDGQTVALGGLITDNRNKSRTGIPVLADIPVLGTLFGTTTNNLTRTELLVLITPHVVRDQRSAADVTEEFRAKLPLIRSLERP
jgi:general secretion pathway protein D